MFGWLKKKAKHGVKADPLAAFDAFILSVDRQGHEVRRSAATLLSLRKELERDVERFTTRLVDLERRIEAAFGDAAAEKTLRRDHLDATRVLDETKVALAKADADATMLVATAEELGRKSTELRAERQSARARLGAGLVVSAALKAKVEEFERVVALDAARDEVERAHALAQLYREEEKG